MRTMKSTVDEKFSEQLNKCKTLPGSFTDVQLLEIELIMTKVLGEMLPKFAEVYLND